MSVNLEVKGIVAKLLAQENLLVEHRQVRTAQFNVDTRVLTLPIWDKASETIVDLLVAHEVGHALYTPNEDWGETVPRQFINVVEDARVEKLIKRRFPGLAKTFYKGYKELHSLDFFSIEDEDLDSMNLADRKCRRRVSSLESRAGTDITNGISRDPPVDQNISNIFSLIQYYINL